MQSANPQNHLLWPMVAEHLGNGRAGDAALCSGRRRVSYGSLAAAVRRGSAEIDGEQPNGSRILIAARDQLRVGVALCAALQSRSTPLLADPTSIERLRALAADWGVKAALLEPGTALSGVTAFDDACVDRWLDGEPTTAFEPRPVAAGDAAFWTFTSGTSGEPKAVVHDHAGPLAAYRAFAEGVLRLGPQDTTISTAGLPFVYALGNNLFFPLMSGGTAILPPDLLLPTVLGELAHHGASVLVAGPWSLAAIARLVRRPRHVEAIRRLRLVLSAGEPLPARVFSEWQRRFGKETIDNLGCTEMFNSFVSASPGRARAGSLGRGVAGFDLRVGGRPLAPGARGALSVRGPSRAILVGRPGALEPPAGEWCDTGDDVEVDADGALRFIGRRDDRFKVRGQFVHPVEIERCVAEVEGVKECLATADRDPNGLTVVVMRVVAAGGDRSSLVRRLLAHARARLPSFAVPQRVDLVASLPRSARGKLDRRADSPSI